MVPAWPLRTGTARQGDDARDDEGDRHDRYDGTPEDRGAAPRRTITGRRVRRLLGQPVRMPGARQLASVGAAPSSGSSSQRVHAPSAGRGRDAPRHGRAFATRGRVRAAIRDSAPSQPASNGLPALVEVDDDRRVVGRDRRALASLAIDLGPDDPIGHDLRDVAGGRSASPRSYGTCRPGSPTTRSARGVAGCDAVGVDEAPVAQRARGRPAPAPTRGFRRGPRPRPRRRASVGVAFRSPPRTSGSAGDRRLVEPASRGARTSAACRRRTGLPTTRPFGAYRLTTRTPPQTAETIRASSNGSKSSSPTATVAPRRCCRAPARRRSSSRRRSRRPWLAIATPFQRPSP